MINLTPRLEKIAELVENSKLTADIGTDHAYLPVSLIEREKAERAIASDIRPGPLSRAKDTVTRSGMDDRISLRLGPGLETLTEDDKADTIIIAGMGGEMIAEILEKSINIVKSAERIIVQPMSSAPELRKYIYGRGFSDIHEHIAAEGNRLYNIISMSPGNEAHPPLEPYELVAGRDIIKSRPEHFDKYIQNLTKTLKVKADGLSRAASADTAEELKRTLKIIKKLEELSLCRSQ